MADFAPFERKMRAAGSPPVAIRAFERAFAAFASGERGLVPRAELTEVGEIPPLLEDPAQRAVGERALAQTVVVKLNGGLGTTMGMTRAKSLLAVRGEQSFLDVTAQQMRVLRERSGAAVPLVLMNSFRTRDESLAALVPHGPVSGPLPPDFLQHRVPRIRVADLTPVSWPERPEHEWCPPGHGDLYAALVSSGMLDAMLAAGLRYAFVSNADNLGAVLDLDLLGWFVDSAAPFAMEVKERSLADRKGGHLARRDGRLLLREIAQCPDDELEDFQDIARHRFFNTNNLWVDLHALREVLDGCDSVLPLPLIRNEKPVDPTDPASERVVQLESAMGAAIALFEGARAIRVPSSRFAPVKTTGDLLAVRSDAFELTADFRVMPAAGRSEAALLVDLDPAFYRRVDDLERRFPNGPPSLLRCRSLTLRGDVRFGDGVVVEGDVRLEAPEGELLEVEAGSVLT
jgi:UTP--glucose-1-phosphate uridylyltransferase